MIVNVTDGVFYHVGSYTTVCCIEAEGREFSGVYTSASAAEWQAREKAKEEAFKSCFRSLLPGFPPLIIPETMPSKDVTINYASFLYGGSSVIGYSAMCGLAVLDDPEYGGPAYIHEYRRSDFEVTGIMPYLRTAQDEAYKILLADCAKTERFEVLNPIIYPVNAIFDAAGFACRRGEGPQVWAFPTVIEPHTDAFMVGYDARVVSADYFHAEYTVVQP